MISFRTLRDAAARAKNCPPDPQERYLGALVYDAITSVTESDEYAKTEGAIVAAIVALLRDTEREIREEYDGIEDQITEAADDIEHAYRFNDPERYRDAYRTLTNHLLHA